MAEAPPPPEPPSDGNLGSRLPADVTITAIEAPLKVGSIARSLSGNFELQQAEAQPEQGDDSPRTVWETTLPSPWPICTPLHWMHVLADIRLLSRKDARKLSGGVIMQALLDVGMHGDPTKKSFVKLWYAAAVQFVTPRSLAAFAPEKGKELGRGVNAVHRWSPRGEQASSQDKWGAEGERLGVAGASKEELGRDLDAVQRWNPLVGGAASDESWEAEGRKPAVALKEEWEQYLRKDAVPTAPVVRGRGRGKQSSMRAWLADKEDEMLEHSPERTHALPVIDLAFQPSVQGEHQNQGRREHTRAKNSPPSPDAEQLPVRRAVESEARISDTAPAHSTQDAIPMSSPDAVKGKGAVESEVAKSASGPAHTTQDATPVSFSASMQGQGAFTFEVAIPDRGPASPRQEPAPMPYAYSMRGRGMVEFEVAIPDRGPAHPIQEATPVSFAEVVSSRGAFAPGPALGNATTARSEDAARPLTQMEMWEAQALSYAKALWDRVPLPPRQEATPMSFSEGLNGKGVFAVGPALGKATAAMSGGAARPLTQLEMWEKAEAVSYAKALKAIPKPLPPKPRVMTKLRVAKASISKAEGRDGAPLFDGAYTKLEVIAAARASKSNGTLTEEQAQLLHQMDGEEKSEQEWRRMWKIHLVRRGFHPANLIPVSPVKQSSPAAQAQTTSSATNLQEYSRGLIQRTKLNLRANVATLYGYTAIPFRYELSSPMRSILDSLSSRTEYRVMNRKSRGKRTIYVSTVYDMGDLVHDTERPHVPVPPFDLPAPADETVARVSRYEVKVASPRNVKWKEFDSEWYFMNAREIHGLDGTYWGDDSQQTRVVRAAAEVQQREQMKELLDVMAQKEENTQAKEKTVVAKEQAGDVELPDPEYFAFYASSEDAEGGIAQRRSTVSRTMEIAQPQDDPPHQRTAEDDIYDATPLGSPRTSSPAPPSVAYSHDSPTLSGSVPDAQAPYQSDSGISFNPISRSASERAGAAFSSGSDMMTRSQEEASFTVRRRSQELDSIVQHNGDFLLYGGNPNPPSSLPELTEGSGTHTSSDNISAIIPPASCSDDTIETRSIASQQRMVAHDEREAAQVEELRATGTVENGEGDRGPTLRNYRPYIPPFRWAEMRRRQQQQQLVETAPLALTDAQAQPRQSNAGSTARDARSSRRRQGSADVPRWLRNVNYQYTPYVDPETHWRDARTTSSTIPQLGVSREVTAPISETPPEENEGPSLRGGGGYTDTLPKSNAGRGLYQTKVLGSQQMSQIEAQIEAEERRAYISYEDELSSISVRWKLMTRLEYLRREIDRIGGAEFKRDNCLSSKNIQKYVDEQKRGARMRWGKGAAEDFASASTPMNTFQNRPADDAAAVTNAAIVTDPPTGSPATPGPSSSRSYCDCTSLIERSPVQQTPSDVSSESRLLREHRNKEAWDRKLVALIREAKFLTIEETAGLVFAKAEEIVDAENSGGEPPLRGGVLRQHRGRSIAMPFRGRSHAQSKAVEIEEPSYSPPDGTLDDVYAEDQIFYAEFDPKYPAFVAQSETGSYAVTRTPSNVSRESSTGSQPFHFMPPTRSQAWSFGGSRATSDYGRLLVEAANEVRLSPFPRRLSDVMRTLSKTSSEPEKTSRSSRQCKEPRHSLPLARERHRQRTRRQLSRARMASKPDLSSAAEIRSQQQEPKSVNDGFSEFVKTNFRDPMWQRRNSVSDSGRVSMRTVSPAVSPRDISGVVGEQYNGRASTNLRGGGDERPTLPTVLQIFKGKRLGVPDSTAAHAAEHLLTRATAIAADSPPLSSTLEPGSSNYRILPALTPFMLEHKDRISMQNLINTAKLSRSLRPKKSPPQYFLAELTLIEAFMVEVWNMSGMESDRVIYELATRVIIDTAFQDSVRTISIAEGNALEEELRTFQGHIEELRLLLTVRKRLSRLFKERVSCKIGAKVVDDVCLRGGALCLTDIEVATRSSKASSGGERGAFQRRTNEYSGQSSDCSFGSSASLSTEATSFVGEPQNTELDSRVKRWRVYSSFDNISCASRDEWPSLRGGALNSEISDVPHPSPTSTPDAASSLRPTPAPSRPSNLPRSRQGEVTGMSFGDLFAPVSSQAPSMVANLPIARQFTSSMQQAANGPSRIPAPSVLSPWMRYMNGTTEFSRTHDRENSRLNHHGHAAMTTGQMGQLAAGAFNMDFELPPLYVDTTGTPRIRAGATDLEIRNFIDHGAGPNMNPEPAPMYVSSIGRSRWRAEATPDEIGEFYDAEVERMRVHLADHEEDERRLVVLAHAAVRFRRMGRSGLHDQRYFADLRNSLNDSLLEIESSTGSDTTSGVWSTPSRPATPSPRELDRRSPASASNTDFEHPPLYVDENGVPRIRPGATDSELGEFFGAEDNWSPDSELPRMYEDINGITRRRPGQTDSDVGDFFDEDVDRLRVLLAGREQDPRRLEVLVTAAARVRRMGPRGLDDRRLFAHILDRDGVPLDQEPSTGSDTHSGISRTPSPPTTPSTRTPRPPVTPPPRALDPRSPAWRSDTGAGPQTGNFSMDIGSINIHVPANRYASFPHPLLGPLGATPGGESSGPPRRYVTSWGSQIVVRNHYTVFLDAFASGTIGGIPWDYRAYAESVMRSAARGGGGPEDVCYVATFRRRLVRKLPDKHEIPFVSRTEIPQGWHDLIRRRRPARYSLKVDTFNSDVESDEDEEFAYEVYEVPVHAGVMRDLLRTTGRQFGVDAVRARDWALQEMAVDGKSVACCAALEEWLEMVRMRKIPDGYRSCGKVDVRVLEV